MQLQTQTKTLVEHTLILSDEQLKKLIEDPYGFRDDVEAALKNGGGAAPAKSQPRRQKKGGWHKLHRTKTGPGAKLNGHAPKESKTRKQIERVPCQDCGVPIATYKQGRHKCKPANVAKFLATA